MIAYDNKIYYDKSREPFYDPEWEEAENANERKLYYRIADQGGYKIKQYKPSLAKLVSKRTGFNLVPIEKE